MTKHSNLIDDAYEILRVIEAMTHQLSQLASAGDLGGLARALEERELLINNAQRTLHKLQNALCSEEERNAVRARLRSVIQNIQTGNDTLLEMLNEQKTAVLGKIQQARRQQKIHAYKR